MHLILGFGKTGASFIRYLERRHLPFFVMDSRLRPPGLSQFKNLNKRNFILGKFDLEILKDIDTVLVSPGISFNNKILVKARELNKKIYTDIELFTKETDSRLILITGTNGKTSVSSMTEYLISEVYKQETVICGGNIGRPILDTITARKTISIVEVSSFHLEHSDFLKSDIAVLLNIGQDHLDRHKSLKEYRRIKQKILKRTRIGLVGQKDIKKDFMDYSNIYNFDNLLDPFHKEISSLTDKDWPFHDLKNIKAVIGILMAMEEIKGNINLINSKENKTSLVKKGLNNLKSFKRLPHRYEILGKKKGVVFINDSKSTNINSMEVALESIQKKFGKRKTLLICGGESKNQDFSKISKNSFNSIKHVLVLGKDREVIKNAVEGKVKVSLVDDLNGALVLANSLSNKGDVVLLSPACSSIDMYQDYQERGEKFKQLAGFE